MSARDGIAVAAAPVTPSKSVSRYRSLRGKSVSDDRELIGGVLADAEAHPLPPITHHESHRSKSSSRYRRRARSVVSPEKEHYVASGRVVTAPTMPNMPLAPKPLNIPSKPSYGSKLSSRADTASVYTTDTLVSIENRFPAPPTSAPPPAPVATAITADVAVITTPVESEFGDADADDGDASSQDLSPDDQDATPAPLRPAPLAPNKARAPAPAPLSITQHEVQKRQDRKEAARWADEVARLEAETDRILAEQKKRDLARLQLQLSLQSPVSARSKPRSPVLEKFSFLKIGRRSNHGNNGAMSSPVSSTSPMASPVYGTRAESLEPGSSPRDYVAAMPTCKPGERLVRIRCRQMSMELPVKATATAADLLVTCSSSLAHPIHTDTSIAIEVCAGLGLERRLRRYERVRDILDSWDAADAPQNSFRVLPTDAFAGDRDLELCSVPRAPEPPRGFIINLYYSHRPGKWNKRYVTLLDTGHMYCSKKSQTRPTEKDAQGICHLSACDIYSPTEAQMRKHLKPPKKFCYAIRSQRSRADSKLAAAAAAGDGAGAGAGAYVHYFCTEDPATAHRFHALVHGWRSWYVVGKLKGLPGRVEVSPTFPKKTTAAESAAALKKMLPPDPPEQDGDGDGGPLTAPVTPIRYHSKKVLNLIRTPSAKPQPQPPPPPKPRFTLDDSPSRIGSFEPLPDVGGVSAVGDMAKEFELASSNPARRRSGTLPASLFGGPKSATGLMLTTPKDESPTFAAGGLLGDSYDDRKKFSPRLSRPHISSLAIDMDNPFTEGSLLSPKSVAAAAAAADDGQDKMNKTQQQQQQSTPPETPEPSSWLPSAVEHTARLQRQREAEAAAAAAARPSTSSGIPSSSFEKARSSAARSRAGSASSKHPPMPLLNFAALPPHGRPSTSGGGGGGGGGHGVRPPAGTAHLVDLATTASPSSSRSFLDVPPPRSAARNAAAGSSRPHTSDGSRGGGALRSRSSAATLASQTSWNSIGQHYPPVPALPSVASQRSMGSREGSDLGSLRSGGGGSGMRKVSEPAMHHKYQQHQQRGRDPRPREVPRSRSGTSRRAFD